MSSLSGSTGFNAGPRQSKIKMKPKGYSQFSEYTPEQHDISAQRQQLSGPDSYYSKIAGGDEQAFNEIEAPAMRQFQALQGQVASRFSNLGGKGSLSSRRSSGFQNEMNQATSNFAQDLAAKRHSLRSEAIQGLHSMYGDLVNESPYGLVEKKKPFWQQATLSAIPGLAEGGSKAASSYFGGF